ncbi:hypothetical protein A0J61_10520 [Choanephora cucurbitarum]|uniref:Uncharacterized protein n=1 Tax=Choanephora cucurbitarum TaxID=101091 RepID=A0A1C7MX99_9FUNG|nr:hypothetical protein A0J61_10520 [Choanephora cucurbitarum]
MPEAKRHMNNSQAKEDATLKHIQYLLSGTFRPLDILASEICTNDLQNDHSQRFIAIINELSSAILNVNASISSFRKDIAFRAFNPNFRAPSEGNQNCLMSSEAFQSAVNQQATANKTIIEASSRGKHGGDQSTSHTNIGKNNPFFRSGPPIDQGGYPAGHQSYIRPQQHHQGDSAQQKQQQQLVP